MFEYVRLVTRTASVPLERARVETCGADRWVLKEFLGFAKLTHRDQGNPHILGTSTISFQLKPYSQRKDTNQDTFSLVSDLPHPRVNKTTQHTPTGLPTLKKRKINNRPAAQTVTVSIPCQSTLGMVAFHGVPLVDCQQMLSAPRKKQRLHGR